MKILVKRIAKKPKYTIGRISIDGVVIGNTIEDTDRGLTQSTPLSEIRKKKVQNETAIPTGTYEVTMDVVSPKFKDRVWAKPYKGKIPRLLNVPGFDGILIHPGTDQDSTSGCLIPGLNTIVGKVTSSQDTFHKIMKILLSAKDKITIEIC